MTKLEMHKRLQPLFKKVMGEWKEGDKAFDLYARKQGLSATPT